ncbi:MAG: CHRD domain-containing protein [Bryobacteraceae bacterium]|nr:CHRD domain-containing protein [Bryobacteraceae bacterium]
MCSLSAQTAESIPFRAVLSTQNEIPPVTDIVGSGTVTAWLRVVRDASGRITSGTVDFDVRYQFGTAQSLTAMHIHRGAANANGPVVIDARLQRTDVSTAAGQLPIYAAQIAAENAAQLEALQGILADPEAYYFNLHSTDKPGGVMRGQLQRASMMVMMSEMSAANEVPPIAGLNAIGTGTVMILTTRSRQGALTSGLVLFNVAYSGFPSDTVLTAMHVHRGLPGVNGGVVLDSAMTRTEVGGNGSGILHFESEMNMTRAAVVSALEDIQYNPGGFYLNVHSVANPGGAIRGPMRYTDRMRFPFNASPSEEVPPVTGLEASAAGSFTVHTIRRADGSVSAGAAIFDANPRFPAGTRFTGMHIHDNVAGQNGPVTIDSRLTAFPILVPETGAGNIWRLVTVNSEAGLRALNSLTINPERHYFNLHTSANPGGAVRAQLAPASTALPSVSAAFAAVSDPGRTTAAPLGLMTIFGSNLTKVETTWEGTIGLNAVPTSLNGTQVTVGGTAAPLLYVGRGQINFQIPEGVAAGRQPLIVTTAAGASPTANIEVAAAAPALFFDETGVIALKNRDFSLVRPNNPAAAGDVLLLYSTGVGTTVPALPAGRIAGGPPYNAVENVVVNVGGTDIRALYTVLTPGYLGLYQTAVLLPSGLPAGTAMVTLRVGTAVSNAAALQLR